ncbi:uncharacterized protein LOC127260816 [Andrographis paniculata]|uniref:uncharacterized protein LOC127260816 n=1 Tax=Andrographis paniculata TaxID=175694 RepID=UPI0021E76F07|nr:uncharacterized protein LOC127260816 [Andrographis paniculata]
MPDSHTSMMAPPSEYLESGAKLSEVSNPSQQPHLPRMGRNTSQGRVAILWDIENCPVPSDVRSEDVAGNIRMALRVHPVIDGVVTMFSAYGDFNAFPRRLREGCQRTGIKLIDVPNGRKDAADKAILIDMFLFALDNSPPSSIMLISGDVDFAPALHILGQRGYTVILVIPSGVPVSTALSNAGRFVWDWPSVARGEGIVPPAKLVGRPRSGLSELPRISMGFHINEAVDGQNDEEAIVYKGASESYCNTRESCSSASQSQSMNAHSSASMPLNPTTSRSHSEQNDLIWVQPGDLNGLKGQLVKLLEFSGGILPLTRLPSEYQKIYGRPLYVSEYGALKLVNLLQKMSDAISVEGKGQRRFICLRVSKPGQVGGPIILARRDKKEKGSPDDAVDLTARNGSSDEFSDDERVIFRVDYDQEGGEKLNSSSVSASLKKFKCELQEILVSYSGAVFLRCFKAIYQQRYKRELDCRSFGVNQLEELLEKVNDVVVLKEEPVSKRKYLVAVGG